MHPPVVSLVAYEKPFDSVRRAVRTAGGLDHLPAGARVFIKPNIVFWNRAANFPKWGVITTSRVVQDVVRLLRDHGITDITIGEGIVTPQPNDRQTPAHAFASLGYTKLARRYGVKVINTFEHPFERLDTGNGPPLEFSSPFMAADFIVNLPVLKTHCQTVVSLGTKNIKGMLNIKSRKVCHNADASQPLDFRISGLADRIPPMLTLADGIFSLERGPGFEGSARRSNLLLASTDVLALDMVGARLLGFDPSEVPHLVYAAKTRNRRLDLAGITVTGEKIETLAARHEWQFPYSKDGTLPAAFEKMGIRGLHYYRYDDTMCTYCAPLNGAILTAIAMAWKGVPFDDVEVLTGKRMAPGPGMKKTILLGQCMCRKHRHNMAIKEMIPIKGCPPDPGAAVRALRQAGIDIDPGIIEDPEKLAGLHMRKYNGKPDFDEAFFQIE